MLSLLNQIYYEGIGATIYAPLEKKLKKIKIKFLREILICIWQVIYLVLLLITATILFYISYPFK